MLNSSGIDYGVVPVVKWDEAQERYYTCVGFPYSLYCIPTDNADPDSAAAVMECMASESYRLVTPQIFEVSLKTKYSTDSDSSKMYDIIRSSISFDLGRIYQNSLGNQTVYFFRLNLKNNDNAVASGLAAIRSTLDSQIKALSDIYK